MYVLTQDATPSHQHNVAAEVRVVAQGGGGGRITPVLIGVLERGIGEESDLGNDGSSRSHVDLGHVDLVDVEARSRIGDAESQLVVVALDRLQYVAAKRPVVPDPVKRLDCHPLVTVRYEGTRDHVRVVDRQCPLQVALVLMVVSCVKLEDLAVTLHPYPHRNSYDVPRMNGLGDTSGAAGGRDGTEEEACPAPEKLKGVLAGINEARIVGRVHEVPRARSQELR